MRSCFLHRRQRGWHRRRDGTADERVLFAANVDPTEGNLQRADRDAMEKDLAGKNVKILDAAAAQSLADLEREVTRLGELEEQARRLCAADVDAKWRELKENDGIVRSFITSPTGQLLTQWMNADAKGINKIVLSGDKSHRVAFTSMPAIYLGKGKPNFDEAFSGKVWQQGESKPDPSTNIDTIQIAVPVKDGGKTIGVFLVSLTAANLK